MFYVYAYFDPTKSSSLHSCGFEPFYVGKGKEDRMYHHLFESNLKGEKNKHKSNKIKKLLKQNIKPYIEIIYKNIPETDALNLEIELIAKWGRADLYKGPLTNMTNGGEGSSGLIMSKEARKKISEAAKRQICSAETRAKISKIHKGKKQSPEHITKRTQKRIGYKHTDETKRLLSKFQKKIRLTKEWKLKASLSQRGKKHSKEHTEKTIISNPKTQPVEVFGIKYISKNQAIRETGLTPTRLIKEKSFKFLLI